MNVFDIVLLLVTLALFTRVWAPWGGNVSGNLVRREDLSLFGRLRMHGPVIALLFAGSIVALVLGWVGGPTVIAVTALLVLMLFVPMRYILTSQGIRAGGMRFRRWTEFGGIARRPGGVRLQGVAGARPLMVWLSGGRDDDEFVLVLRQLVRGSYKGELGPEASAPAPGASPGTVQIAGVGGS